MERIPSDEILRIAKSMRPTELDYELHFWLSEIESRVVNEMYDGDESVVKPGLLLLGFPFGDVYWTYLVCMVDFSRGDLESYKISRAMHEKAWSYFIRTFDKKKHVDHRNPVGGVLE